MEAIVVIPARYGSSRFPGKPLAPVAGCALLERVWRIASSVQGISGVFVATDDDRIATFVRSFGGEAVMTSPSCANGSERVHEALQGILAKQPGREKPRVVVNLQGDAVLMPPWVLEGLVAAMVADPSIRIATPAVRLTHEQHARMAESKGKGVVSGTTVVFSRSKRALYFSKAIIPFLRTKPEGEYSPVFQHIGMYAYTPDALAEYISLPEGELENVEQLEQLRPLEHDLPIHVVEVSLRGRTIWPIDTPQDVQRVEEIIAREGELLPYA